MAFDFSAFLQQPPAASGGGAGGMAEGLAGATPYGAAANAAKGVADAVFGGGASATAGDTGAVTHSTSFGGVMIGDTALTSPGAYASGYTSRRLASGQTAAAMPGTPEGRAVMGPDGLVYSSTVSASPSGLVAVAGVAAVGLLFLFLRKK